MTYACETAPSGPAATFAARMTAMVPRIVTQRLVLRAPHVGDFPAYADIACTKHGKYIGGPMTREDAWFDFIQFSSSWMLHGHGGWTISGGDGILLGFAILGFEPGDREVELGYLLTKTAQGHGYATEAAMAVRDWGFATYGWSSLVSYIYPGNTGSISVAQRLGATRDTSEEAHFDDEIRVYRHHAKAAQ